MPDDENRGDDVGDVDDEEDDCRSCLYITSARWRMLPAS